MERTGNWHIELLNLVTLGQGIYHKTKVYVAEREADSMRNMMVRMMEDMNLIKGKLGIGTVEEIAKAKRVEADKKKEAEERKKKTEDKNEVERKAKAQKEEEKRRKNAEELAAAEEEKQRKEKEQARAKVEQLQQEEERLVKERPTEDATPVEVKTWADVLAEAGKKKEAAEGEAKKAYHGVGIGSGWEVEEGKAMRTVEVTIHF